MQNTVITKNKKKIRKKKKKFSIKKLLLFIIFQIVFLIITTPLWVFRGPFQNVKRTVVGSIMASRHQYLATIFLSKAEVNNLINKNSTPVSSEAEDLNEIEVTRTAESTSNSIDRKEIHNTRIDAYILLIPDPTTVKVGMTKMLNKVGQRTSEIAEENGGIAAINGGAFADANMTGTGAIPGGIVITDGELKFCDAKNYDTKVDVTGFTRDGKMIMGDYSYNQLKQMDVVEALSFGMPHSRLIINGKPQLNDDGGQGISPRTVIGQKKDGTVIMLVVDGRGLIKNGASLEDVQNIMLSLGAWNASNLDGGSSSTMYYDGNVINNPSNWDGERTVATAFYVKGNNED